MTPHNSAESATAGAEEGGHRSSRGKIMHVRRATKLYLQARAPEVRPLTLRQARYTLEDLSDHIGDMALKAVKPKHLQGWLGTHKWAPSTALLRLSIVRGFFAWCYHNDLIATDPATKVKGPSRARAIPRELSVEQVAAIFAAAPDRRASAMLSLIFHEGLRRGEVCGLDVGDLDRDVLLVTGKGGHERLMPLSEESLRAVTAYLAEWPIAYGPMFRSYQYPDRRLHPDTIGRLISLVMYEAGVKERPWDGKSPHAGRHTFAGAMIDSGADIRVVSDALGHEHESTTSLYLRKRRTVAEIRPFLPRYTG